LNLSPLRPILTITLTLCEVKLAELEAQNMRLKIAALEADNAALSEAAASGIPI